MSDYDEIVMRVPKGLVPNGCTLEWRPPNEGETFLHELNGTKTAECNHSCKRPVIVPPFDLAKWWPEWLGNAERVESDAGQWTAFVGDWTRIANLQRLGVDCSQLDRHRVYYNPHRKETAK